MEQRFETVGIGEVAKRIGARRSVWQIADTMPPAGNLGRRRRIVGQGFALSCTNQDKAFAVLRRAEMRGIENAPGNPYLVPGSGKLLDKLIQKCAMLADSKSLHVFEYECLSLELRDDTKEVTDQPVTRVVQHAMPDQGKSLAGGAAEYAIDAESSDAGCFDDLCT